ncbi:DNA mismatch repair endonuclease MutH [Gallaecimonas xiamenensis]|uniref:DNA mismatch repair protein MutH n=1 Tax=Gallaecimonas xiamenensis 3-C-1 TaxID=745411 RepID=K2JT17_9GAMM|nr:DNA mismatch repair endonuclease MutH [Gallaecimonas xiamenensis]EKE68290.1 DNA mismatch repair protein [Gallaecimonas xiamenensis 3-C-1]
MNRPQIHSQPPADLDSLMQRAHSLAGYRLADLGPIAGIGVPKDLKREKGWMGMLLEMLLGAEAGSKPEPDFPSLGVELKTLPVDRHGKPLESTFVAVAPLEGWQGVQWHNSHVRHKLSCVLWIPILAERGLPPAERVVATPFLWRPSLEQEQALRQDWEELVELLALGRFHEITAYKGQFLQLRPKAAHGAVKVLALDQDGNQVSVQPKGFYLRSLFTRQLLADAFNLA